VIQSLHIGGGLVLNGADIVGIFSDCAGNGALIESYKARFRLKNISEENSSFILVKKRSDPLIYYSKISAGKLVKRLMKENSGGS
jgi:hypothetical protein